MSKQLLKELFSESVEASGLHIDVLLTVEQASSELSARARKKKRIYKRKKPEDKITP
jgi:hypothetical protein